MNNLDYDLDPTWIEVCKYIKTLPDAYEKMLAFFETLPAHEAELLKFEWAIWGRENQKPPDTDWRYWLLLAGRGFGKTRTGSEWIKHMVHSEQAQRIALIGPTFADVRDVMIEGNSGILAVSYPWNRPIFESSKRKLTWPSGAIAFAYSADEPERLRGPEHDALWADELGSWRYPSSWDNAMMGLRAGENPRAVVTTTPRPLALLNSLLQDPHTHVTRGSTFDNEANLPAPFLDTILKKYEGTPLGAQEIYAEMLTEIPGVLWKQTQLDASRIETPPDSYDMVVVAVDPAVSMNAQSNETGIVVVGRKGDKGYVLEDLSGSYPANVWVRIVEDAFHRHKARRVIAEKNQGGDLIENILHLLAPGLPYMPVYAISGKAARAQPIAALYAQGKIHHIGVFPKLEDQMITCDMTRPETSPDRVDAMVWGFTHLFLELHHPVVRCTVI